MNLKNFLIVFAGSGIGGMLRYTVQYFLNTKPNAFPTGTFLVNIVGCFCIGILYMLSEKAAWMNTEWRLALATGFCGGFTTFSAFAMENVSLIRAGNYGLFALYVLLSIVLGILAAFAGGFIFK